MPPYYIAYERDGKNGYVASAPALPGCLVYGKTVQEAYRNIQSAIQECLEVILDILQFGKASTPFTITQRNKSRSRSRTNIPATYPRDLSIN